MCDRAYMCTARRALRVYVPWPRVATWHGTCRPAHLRVYVRTTLVSTWYRALVAEKGADTLSRRHAVSLPYRRAGTWRSIVRPADPGPLRCGMFGLESINQFNHMHTFRSQHPRLMLRRFRRTPSLLRLHSQTVRLVVGSKHACRDRLGLLRSAAVGCGSLCSSLAPGGLWRSTHCV